MADTGKLGISGRLAARFQDNPLTPILAILGLLLGLVAVLVTPQEEEPQIDVTMANVFVPFPGADARQVEQLVSFPLEKKLSEIEGVKHVYSISRPGMALLTVEYTVGVERQPAIVRLYNQVYSNQDWMPPGVGVGQPLVKPKGIDDVPVMALTLWSDDPAVDGQALAQVAHSLETELKRVPGTRDVYTLGAYNQAVTVELDPGRLAAYGLSVHEVAQALQASNQARHAGDRVGADGATPVQAGRFLADNAEVTELVIGLSGDKPVRLSDVARIGQGLEPPTQLVWHGAPAGRAGPATGRAPAVTVAIAKKPGSNAADITATVRERLDGLRAQVIPDGVQVEITRDYGQSAADKAAKLIQKLIFATLSVVLLVLFALGRREAVVVGSAVILTLAITLFASWAMGFTLNRVSLFALIFSIGILVDDAIVVVENIHRHRALGGKSLREAIPLAVDEVGAPTILATFTVIAALLPMAFVSGLMGPYMRPIPINASVGMLISLLIALVVTPWLSLKLLAHGAHAHGEDKPSKLQSVAESVMGRFIVGPQAANKRRMLWLAIAVLLALSAGLAVVKLVVLKMLPNDNKSEIQLVVDMPEGSTLEQTNALLGELAVQVDKLPEVLNYQAYAGTSAPVTFNGLVRQYFLRQGPLVGDLQINLADKHERSRKSHDIALALRPTLQAAAAKYGASLKVVEVPPGPPVMAPLVAEIYGPDYARSRAIATQLQQRMRDTEGVVDIDSTVEAAGAQREQLIIDQARAARLGVSREAVTQTLLAAVDGADVSYLQDGRSRYPKAIRLRLPASAQADMARILQLGVKSSSGRVIALSELVQVRTLPWDGAIHHKDLLPVVYVTADEAGEFDSPLYGMFDVVGQLADLPDGPDRLRQYFISQPESEAAYAVKWDGEWQITYETFRDMGLAYAAGLLLIYLLIVAQFKNYLVPLIIMAPIPLTVIGVMPGHALLGAQFTATSMIGMIALAGIIVRNSILLVDFINQSLAEGKELGAAVIESVAVRAKPIALTGLAAMLGAFFILDDPIFNGLAIALIFGILVSTVLTLVVIPLLYYVYLRRREA
ncbi:multidrug transporter AcrB [Arenimonas maotaiensis]|uniref:Multidrug transporter AcrB n=1 Tax=Arenimonas maotaiensis TaxID=1446479 RepID=A0A917FQ73_9GAMM|nr:efflux RND transporter permease subunit [Arenimonas maotaiensis]GGF94262.1 multidrug transporter AcrB [Arenimonas maotaiensis]